MNTITVTYTLYWQLKYYPEYKFTKCKKCFNTKTGKQIKQVSQNGCIGYNIRGKFSSNSWALPRYNIGDSGFIEYPNVCKT